MKKLGFLGGILGALLILVVLVELFTSANLILPIITVEEDIMLFLVGLIACLLFGYGIISLNFGSFTESEVGLALEDNPETANDKNPEKVMKLDPEKSEKNRKTIEKLLIDIQDYQTSATKQEIKKQIENGNWTENRIAAAYISDTINYPLLERLRGWLEEDKETDERRLRETIDEIKELSEKRGMLGD